MNITKTKIYRKILNEMFPVFQSFHTGKWGYRTLHGCSDLNSAIFKSEQAAKFHRGKDNGVYWNVLAGNLARFLNIDYLYARVLLCKAAIAKYGEDFYGVLWLRVGTKDMEAPYRDARGVKTYLERLQKKGLL